MTDHRDPGTANWKSIDLQGVHFHREPREKLLELDPNLRSNPLTEEWTVEQVEKSILLTTVDKFMRMGQANSVWPAMFGLACCAIEMMNTVASRTDISRFGAEVFRASPRQADLMIIAGRVSQKMARPMRQIYDQMLEPKWVIAMGACSSSGGMFSNYAVVQGAHKIVPVDVHVPGCPPRPEQLLHGFTVLQEKIKRGDPPAYLQEVGRRNAGESAREPGDTSTAAVGGGADR